MLVLILIFAGVHSGLASFRDSGEKLIGERAYRVLFAGTSLPLALTMIVSTFFSYKPHKNFNIINTYDTASTFCPYIISLYVD